jgi:hypothetical protein
MSGAEYAHKFREDRKEPQGRTNEGEVLLGARRSETNINLRPVARVGLIIELSGPTSTVFEHIQTRCLGS